VGKPEGRTPIGRPRRRWVDNIRMDLQEVGCGYMDWIGLAQDRDRWRPFPVCRSQPHSDSSSPPTITGITLYLQSTRTQFLPYILHILGSSQLLSLSHFSPLKSQHLSPFHHHTLRCPVYCSRRFCHFALFVPQYGYRTFMTCLYQFRYMATLSNCATIS